MRATVSILLCRYDLPAAGTSQLNHEDSIHIYRNSLTIRTTLLKEQLNLRDIGKLNHIDSVSTVQEQQNYGFRLY
jgi:hypothetical protein